MHIYFLVLLQHLRMSEFKAAFSFFISLSFFGVKPSNLRLLKGPTVYFYSKYTCTFTKNYPQEKKLHYLRETY